MDISKYPLISKLINNPKRSHLIQFIRNRLHRIPLKLKECTFPSDNIQGHSINTNHEIYFNERVLQTQSTQCNYIQPYFNSITKLRGS